MLFSLVNMPERHFDVAALPWVISLQKSAGALTAGPFSHSLVEAGLLYLPGVVLLRVRALTSFADGILGFFQSVTLKKNNKESPSSDWRLSGTSGETSLLVQSLLDLTLLWYNH